MHSYIMTRGIKREVETFIDDLQAQWTKYNMHGKSHILKVGVRPIQLWEIVYPEQCQDDVMKMLMPYGH